MNKADLIDAVAEDSDLTKTSAARALDSAIENITKDIHKLGEVSKKGRELILKFYSPSKIAKKYIEIYKEIYN